MKALLSRLATLRFAQNCLSNESDLSRQLVNRGDHLLVWKNAYQFRNPQRGEVIVFHNPNEPRETYIKRVAALPGEEVQIREGNIWIDGKIVQKTMDEQRAQRILIYDSAFEPNDSDDWVPRWSSDVTNSGWSRTPSGWTYSPQGETHDELIYRHTMRFGGTHDSTVCLPESVKEIVASAFVSIESSISVRCRASLSWRETGRKLFDGYGSSLLRNLPETEASRLLGRLSVVNR